jgi:hypothetical protein
MLKIEMTDSIVLVNKIFHINHSAVIQGCQIVYFQTQITNLGQILDGLATENVSSFNGHLVNLTAIWYILLAFGIFYRALVFCAKKNLASRCHRQIQCYMISIFGEKYWLFSP